MKTKITSPQYGYVTLTRDDDETDGPETTTYFVNKFRADRPSYVRILDDAGQYPQVCELLSNRGNTLMATPDTLETVIRAELRRARAKAKRERSRW
jgi:hypothetical protein